MGKQEESKNKKNEKIINTAFRIFVEKKIEPVSITEIAEKAGVGRATVFRYYPTKVDLAIAVCSANGRNIWMSWMQSDRSLPSRIFLRSTD